MGGRGETESLNAGENLPVAIDEPAWRNSLEFQRTLASGVHQAGGTKLSTELGAIFKAPYTMNLDDYRLKDWRDFPAVSGESGVGTYTASTVLDEGWRADEGDGLWLNLGRVDGTASIWVNGEFVGTQVDNERRWDGTDHLHTGTNTFEVKVRTTLRNAVTKYNQNATVTQPYGLRGPLRLDPYDSVVVYDPQR